MKNFQNNIFYGIISKMSLLKKVTILKWHPLSAGVLAAASGDLTIKIWDIPRQRVSIVLEGHQDQVCMTSYF